MGVIEGAGQVLGGRVRAYTKFEMDAVGSKLAGGAVTGSAGDESFWLVPGVKEGLGLPVVQFQGHVMGTQTILGPSVTADGWDIGMDQTDNDGYEFAVGGITSRNPLAHVVGTDGGAYLELLVKIADVSGADPFLVGFRKAEDFQADWNSYDELAAIGLFGADIKTSTILNNAATVDTDTTDNASDGTALRLGVFVSPAGVVTYQVNRAAPTTTVAFSFDSGEVLIPFIFFLHGSDVAGTVVLQELDVVLRN